MIRRADSTSTAMSATSLLRFLARGARPCFDAFLEGLQLRVTEDVAFNEAAHELFYRAVAQPVDDLSDRPGGKAPRRFDRAIDVGASCDVMMQVAFLFQPAEDGACGDFLGAEERRGGA